MSGPTIDQAKAFCEVAEKGSYQVVADRQKVSRVSIVRLTERFAESVGRGDLFLTVGRGRVELTAAGRELLPPARRFVAAADALAEKRNEIRFSAYPSIVKQLMTQRSDLLEAEIPLILVDVSVESRGDGGRGLVHAVSSGRLDLAVAPGRLLPAMTLTAAGLLELPLYRWRLRVVLPKLHGLRKMESLAPADLSGLKIGAAPKGHRSRYLLERVFEAANMPLQIALESDSQEMLHAVALASERHAAVIPDDAFGAPDAELGPCLIGRGSEEAGGDYSLYLRDPAPPGVGSPAERERRVGGVAREIQRALNVQDGA